MNLELMKLKRDQARVYAAKIDQEIAVEEMTAKVEALKTSIKASEEALLKLEKQIKESQDK